MQSEKSKQIGYLLERTTRIVKLSFHKAIAKLNLDLTPEQWVIMESLYLKNGQSQKDLANSSFKNAPTISRILDVLGRKKFIERLRFNNDRRRYKIYLTVAGKEIVEQLMPVADDLRNQGWENLTEGDYQEFVRILNQVFANLDKS